MILVSEILVRVVHVFTGVDVEVLLLGVLDFKHVSLHVSRVLSEIGTKHWGIIA